MVRMPKRDREEEGSRMNPNSSAGIYATESVEADSRLIVQNRKIKEEEKIKMIKVNALKRSIRMNQCGKSFVKLVDANANLPNDTMYSEYPSTPLLQVLLCLSTNIIKDSYQHLGGNMGNLPNQKKQAVAEAIMREWGERIWVMGSDTCVL